MNLDQWMARCLPGVVLALVLLLLGGLVVLASSPAAASVGPRSAQPPGPPQIVPNSRGAIATAQLGGSTSSPLLGTSILDSPRCRLDVTQKSYRAGDTVRASLHLSNPTPATTQVEMKIWFSAPGEVPLSLADPAEAGRALELPGMLSRDSGDLRLFAVDETTPRGTYEMNCRLIDPTTGALLSEDLNDFEVN